MMNVNEVVLGLAIGYALLGVVLLSILVFARLAWPIKAALIVVTSAFYVVNFVETRALLGWSSIDPLPPRFKLLSARIVEPHSLAGEPGRDPSLGRGTRPRQFPERRSARLSPALRRETRGEGGSRHQGERGREAAGRTDGGFRHGRGRRQSGDGARGDAVLDHHDRRGRSIDGGPARSDSRARREREHRLYAARSSAHACERPAIASERRALRSAWRPAPGRRSASAQRAARGAARTTPRWWGAARIAHCAGVSSETNCRRVSLQVCDPASVHTVKISSIIAFPPSIEAPPTLIVNGLRGRRKRYRGVSSATYRGLAAKPWNSASCDAWQESESFIMSWTVRRDRGARNQGGGAQS